MKIEKLVITLIMLVFVAACATSAKVENMAPNTLAGEQVQKIENHLSSQVKVATVAGGKKTNPLWTSEIDSDSFKQALVNSLQAVNLFSESGRFHLDATLLEVKQPMMGLSMTVTTHIEYVVVDTSTSKEIFRETIVAPYTAKMSDAFAGVKRLRLANEGSARENISVLIEKLAALEE